MKRLKMPLLAAAACLFFSANADAQLLGKIKRAANTADNAANTAKDVNDAAKNVKGAVKGAKGKASGGSNMASGLKLNWNEFQQTPAITFNSLLYGTSFNRFMDYTGTFIPRTTAAGKEVNTITDQAEYLRIKIYKGDQYITYFEYDGRQAFDDGKKTKFNTPGSRYQRDGEWVGMPEIDFDKYGNGQYRLDFYAGDKMFYSFDFEMAKITNPDPYGSIKELMVVRGPWEEYAFLQHADSGNLLFGFYLSHEEFKPNASNSAKTNKAVKWSAKISKDGKPFAQHYGNGDNTAQVKQAQWEEVNCAFKPVGKGDAIKFSSLTDGAYKVELTLEGEAKPRTYNFTVKNKQIVQIPQQDRTKNQDPTRLIEGWNDFFWMKREK